jgi:peptide/nickel transport system substrate-binding protein
MRVRRFAAIVLAGMLATAALVACTSAQNTGKSNATGVLNVGAPNGPQTENHNPFLSSSAAYSLGYRWMIYEPLVMTNQVRPADAGKPWLATKWEWSENFSKLVLTVRDNVKWSDGKPMTADDVAYTFGLIKGTPALNKDAIAYKDVTASGNQVTVTFTGSQFVNQTKVLTTLVVPKHIWSQIKDPTTDPNKSPVGTGPYALKSFTSQTVTLTVRDSYWQDLPKVAELRYTSYTDNNAQTAALTSGACEWAFVFIPNYKTVYTSKDPAHYKLWFPPTLGIHGLWINTQRKPFDNPALRRAMNLAIDRDDIFNIGESGYFYPKIDSFTGIPTPAGESFIAPEYKGKTHKVDIEAAKKELTTAGFTFDGNTLKDPTGKPVTITLTNPAGWSDYVTDLEIIKDNLSKIGIVATVDKANQDAWMKAVDEGNFDAAMHWTNGGATPYDIYQNIMDGSIFKPIGTGSVSGNYGRFQSPEATAALQQYANASDEASRTAAMNTLQKIMVEQMPMVPTSAANAGGEYSTKNWTGWPEEQNPYAPAQPSLLNSLDVVLHLKPAA